MQQTPQQRPRPCRAGFRELCIATAALMLAGGLSGGSAGAAPQVRTANDGQLIMQDVPPIPAELADSLRRFQNTRSAVLFDWTGDGEGLYISTRFAATAQIHRVMQPGGAREQLTWFNDAVGSAVRQRGTEMLAFTMDAGGNEFSQIFFLDPADRQARMVSDGVSRNGALLWSHDGSQLAFASTRRDGAANDIWLMSP